MKKYSILAVVVLVASLFISQGVSGQAIEWTSGFQVQNLNDSQDASVLISYYNQDGTLAIDPPVSATIPMGRSANYFPIHPAAGFNGSVVVEADQPVVAIANTLGDYPQYAASTESFSAGANEVKLPLVMRENAGFYTWYNVQNTSAIDDAVVSVQYKALAGNDWSEGPFTIKPGASRTFDQKGATALGSPFLGSALITSSQPVVATVMQVGDTYKMMMGYNGFTAGSSTVSMPLIMNLNNYYTAFQVQNVGTGPTTVTASFGDNLVVGGFAPTDESKVDLAAGESWTFYQNAGQWDGESYLGSGSLTSDREPIVAIVNQASLSGTPVGTAYNGFDPLAATAKVSAPLIMANNNGFYTGFQVMNVGTGPTDITVTYGTNLAGAWMPSNETKMDLAVGDSYNSNQSEAAWTDLYLGSAVIEASPGSKIVMIVNQISPAAGGDQFMTYDGFNY